MCGRTNEILRKPSKPEPSAGSLEGAIDYALNRDKTERTVFEDVIGCTCESAYQDMLATKRRFHKTEGVQGHHLIQSFAEGAGEMTPELAHLIGVELAEQLLKGKYEVIITTHLNTDHYHNHLVFDSVSLEDGKNTTVSLERLLYFLNFFTGRLIERETKYFKKYTAVLRQGDSSFVTAAKIKVRQ